MWRRWLRLRREEAVNKEDASVQSDMYLLYEEIKTAKREWDNAIRHFEYALGKDQVDYAIFAIEAAQKRYEMLLRKAKALPMKWPKWFKGEVI